jgi:hypothetical protein
MTDDYEDWGTEEQPAWQPKTPKEQREALGFAPLATLRATPKTAQAAALMRDLAGRYSRPQAAKGKAYARGKTLVRYANAVGAFVADLLVAAANKRSEGWLSCSHRKTDYTGKYVRWATFDSVRKAWLEAGLIEHKPGYPGALAFGNPGPTSGKLTRYRATPRLLEIAAEHGITPANVLENFRLEFEMPSELIRLTQPSAKTPDTPKVAKLRGDVAELNDFFAKQTLTPPAVKHLGWVRMFHGYTEGFRWNKGGRLYSQPQGPACYQNLPENVPDARKITRSQLRINGEEVVEIDLSSSFLTIFYALCDEQLDLNQDAYAGTSQILSEPRLPFVDEARPQAQTGGRRHLGKDHVARAAWPWSKSSQLGSDAGYGHFFAGRYREASSWAERSIQEHISPVALRVLAASLALAGKLEEARDAAVRLMQLSPALRVSHIKTLIPIRRPDDLARLEEGLRLAGLPEG